MRDDFDRMTNSLALTFREPNAVRRRPASRVGGRISLPLSLLAGLITAFVPASWAWGAFGVAILPKDANVVSGTTQDFTAWRCPTDLISGVPQVGPDGVPGTSDDLCEPVVVIWSVQGPIGTLSDSLGTSTSLTPVDLPPGQSVSGAVVAENTLGTAFATVNVFGAVSPSTFSCFAGEGQKVKEVYEYIDIDGTVYEIVLECDGASGLFSIGSDPSGNFFEIFAEMLLGAALKYTDELISRPTAGAPITNCPFLEQEHKVREADPETEEPKVSKFFWLLGVAGGSELDHDPGPRCF